MFINRGGASKSFLVSFAEDIYFRFKSLKSESCDLEIDESTLKEVEQKLAKETKLDFKQPLVKNEYVVFDLETTGFKPFAGDEVISIGAVPIIDGKIEAYDSFHSYVNPQRGIPEKVVELTGITEEMVKDSPDIMTVLNDFLDFVDGRHLIAHHASFDTSFINFKLQKYCNRKLNLAVLDTCELARLTYPYLDSYSLDYLAGVNNLPVIGRHTSLNDALITARIYLNMLKKLNRKGVLTIEDLINFWKKNFKQCKREHKVEQGIIC
ncbi:3'-5' exonuclease [Fuchsiella alkaliacetigena]|uniref:3'-5' exonuclease n=1 Tax=Fuchsiella alkaliacetigena TaxID=957042 RepID=UPI00200A2459|nr:exonuclease domain-containing protein [Fuchsiella alkaliacetigena]MCK8823793.1 hypothetical protein [Fuchsiella alkaliacetigena]